MKHGTQLSLAGLVGVLAFGVAQAQPQDNPAPNRAPPPLREPNVQPLPANPGDLSSNPHPSASSDEHAAAAADKSGADPGMFVKKAALGGMTEVELGKLAQSMAQDSSVRKFADQMVKDHGKANMELATLAKSKGLPVPTALDAEHQAVVQKLKSKSGADFDAAYSKQMMEDHDKTIALFKGAANSSDHDLAAFAEKTLPTLEEHKDKADELPSGSSSYGPSPRSR
jgi:putative membrane protein